MISAFFIFNQKGELLISRLFRPDVKRSVADVFRAHVIANPNVRSPIFNQGQTAYLHVRHENLYMAIVTRSNINAACVFEWCYRLIAVGANLFGKWDDEIVRNNFVLVYELLEEMVDFGYPQNTNAESLKTLLVLDPTLQNTTHLTKRKEKRDPAPQTVTVHTSGATPWRPPSSHFYYKRNEVFIDVVESVNCLISAQGDVLQADVVGQVLAKAYLTGMPECKFGLNDRIMLQRDVHQSENSGIILMDDCQFHQCVRLDKFDQDRTITFIPPDGEFELMRYRTSLTLANALPFRLLPTVEEIGQRQVDIRLVMKSQFVSRLVGERVVVKFLCPPNTAQARVKTSAGKGKYVAEENAIFWKIPKWVGGGLEHTLTASIELTPMTVKRAWSRAPISVDFQVLMFTASGLVVRFLKVFEKSGYDSIKWVRYMTKAGSYEIRC